MDELSEACKALRARQEHLGAMLAGLEHQTSEIQKEAEAIEADLSAFVDARARLLRRSNG